VELASWPLAGQAVTIGGGGQARSRGSSPAGLSLPSQVLAAVAVGSRARAGRAAGGWEPAGPRLATERRFGPVSLHSLFPWRQRGGAAAVSGRADPPPPGRWSFSLAPFLFAETQVK
jgi:hypothetical protein